MPSPTPANPTVCPECRGAKHILRNGAWVRCACIKEAADRMRMTSAGVPEMHCRLPMPDLLARSFFVAKPRLSGAFALPNDDRTVLVWVMAPASSPRRLASVSYAVRAAIEAGHPAQAFRLSGFLDAQFDRDQKRAMYDQLKTARVAAIEVDTEHGHKFLPQVFMDVYTRRARSTGVTVYFSADDLGEMTGRYGPEISSLFAHSKSILRIRHRSAR